MISGTGVRGWSPFNQRRTAVASGWMLGWPHS